MLNYSKIASDLRSRVKTDDATALRYVVLDARLALEEVAFERLRVVNKKYLADDLNKWRPKDVMAFLIAEIDENAAREFTLSVSRLPVDEANPPSTAEEFQKIEYETVGVQSGFDVKKLNRVWQALSSFLHASFEGYAVLNTEKAKKTILRASDFFDSLADGNLLMVGGLESFRFECVCGRPFFKKTVLVKKNSILTCPRLGCMESYAVTEISETPIVERRYSSFSCTCGRVIEVPLRYVDEMKGSEQVNFKCECGLDGIIKHGKSRVLIKNR